MSARDDILDRVRRNQPAACAMPVIPPFPAPRGSLPERFKAAVKRMGGKVAEPPPGAVLQDFVRALFPGGAIFASATPEVAGDRDLGVVRNPRDLADVDVGVVRAVFGVAETGSVWLTCREFRVRQPGLPRRSTSSCCSIRRASSATCTTRTGSGRSSTPGTASS